MSEMPEPWRTWMEQRELEPTYRRLARETDLGVETVRQAIVGKGRRPSAETVRRLAVVLHRSPNELDQLWGYKQSPLERYQAPAASARLTPKQRKALDNLILAMVEPQERRRSSEDPEVGDQLHWKARVAFGRAAEGIEAFNAELVPDEEYRLAANRERASQPEPGQDDVDD